jgi:hypothetical protein
MFYPAYRMCMQYVRLNQLSELFVDTKDVKYHNELFKLK